MLNNALNNQKGKNTKTTSSINKLFKFVILLN